MTRYDMLHRVKRLLTKKQKPITPPAMTSTPQVEWHKGWKIKTEVYAHNLRRLTVKMPNAYHGRGVDIRLTSSADAKVVEVVHLLECALTELSGQNGASWYDKHNEMPELRDNEKEV